MMKRFFYCVVVFALPFTCMAEDAPKRADVEELLTLSGVKTMMDDSMDAMEQLVSSMSEQQLKQHFADSPELIAKQKDVTKKAHALIRTEMTWDKLKGDFINAYAETFNQEEITGLIAFYNSPIGKALVKKQPELMKRSMEISQKRMMEMMPKLQAMLEEEFKHMKEDSQKKE